MTFHAGVLERLQGLPDWQQRVLLFALALLVGFVVVRWSVSAVDRAIRRAPHLDDTLRTFLATLTAVLGWTLLLVVLLAIVGVSPTALAGGLAVGGFVMGFALKDILGNLAAGVILLLYRPFRVGETVTIGGETGEVQELGMSMTRMRLADGRLAMVPNGLVLGDTVINHTREPIRRADVAVGIGYEADIDAAVKAILDALAREPRVLSEPAPVVRIMRLADSSVDLQVGPWVRTQDMVQAQADFHGLVKRALDAAGISIPYPQRDVHVHPA